MDQLVEVG